MRLVKGVVLPLCILMITGCAVKNGTAIPVEEVGESAPEVFDAPGLKDGAAPLAQENVSAVRTLVAAAEKYWVTADYASAANSLERAIRIAPRDPGLYYRLAYVRLAQKNYAQTLQICKKAISLANGEQGLVSRCEALISQAERAQSEQ